MIDQLQAKIRSYKKQIEEAEEIAALNLAKFRQTQSNMADTSERADIQEQVQYRQGDTVQHGRHQREGRHTGAGTVRQTQSNMADTSERADIQEQVQSGRHSPTWRTPARGQTYRSRYSQADTVQHGGHQ